jgi:hypothetical protein
MSDLNTIAIRVMRGGRPISAFVSELVFLTAEELENLSPEVREPIVSALNADPAWQYDHTSERWQWGRS